MIKARIYFLNNNVPEYSLGNENAKVRNTWLLKILCTPKLEHNIMTVLNGRESQGDISGPE